MKYCDGILSCKGLKLNTFKKFLYKNYLSTKNDNIKLKNL